jgi:peptide/nickel transport system ATP-binding protein
MLRGVALWFRYRPGTPWVLHGTSVELAPGEILGLQGPSGCGKSTLGRVLAGIAAPQHGHVEVDAGRTPTGAHPVQLVLQHAERAMDPRWRVRDVLAETGATPAAIAAIEDAILDPAWRDRFPHEISGGELQRVNLARALLAQPRYVIADEITSSVDPLTQADIWHVLTTHAAEHGVGVLAISHDRALLDAVCDRTVTFDAIDGATTTT